MFKTKKLLPCIIAGIASLHTATAQTSGSSSQWSSHERTYSGQTYGTYDSTYIRASRMQQHTDFVEHRYIFPPKPRNMWEIGAGAGLYNLFADVPSLMIWQDGGYGFHGHIRKAWGYVISSRLQYNYGIAKGLQWQESRNYKYNTAWNQNYNPAGNPEQLASDAIHYNYRMESHQVNIDMIATANNIRFHKERTALSVYGFVGIGTIAYKTYVNTLNGSQPYDYYSILGDEPQIEENKEDIKRKLRASMDDSYETAAESEAGRSKAEFGRKGLGGVGKTVLVLPSVGGGIQFRLSRHVNFSIEDRVSIPIREDLLDGQRWAEQVFGSPVETQRKDIINYLNIGFNFNIGGRKSIEPLYWINPMIYAYTQLDNGSHIVMPEMFLSDLDMDGIADQFDQCPNTPQGVAVDNHGCPLDTDGDLVPDYRDKQLITPTECQPSDEDGIGKCPCPECPPGTPQLTGCDNIRPGVLSFRNGDAELTQECKRQLDVVALQLRGEPNCKILIKTFPKQGPVGRRSQQLSQERLTRVSDYLRSSGGVSTDRIRWKLDEYMEEGSQTVEYRTPAYDTEGWPVYVSPRNGNEN